MVAPKPDSPENDEIHAAPPGREHQAFPQLTDDQIDRATAFGTVESHEKGFVVFERGDKTVDFFIVLDGSIEIYDYDCDGQPHVFTTHGEHQFTGELDLYSDRKILVSGRLGEDGRVLRLSREQFKELLAAEPDIGDVVMRAFILRRIGLIESSLGGALLIGRRNKPKTLELERFLKRNGYPLRVVYEDDDRFETVLDHYEVTAADVPVLVCGPGQALSQPSISQAAECLGLTEPPDTDTTYDVAVVGAGPGGLAAAVYAASEGLRTVILEGEAPGGQASWSSKIENYLGFPNGLSGQELAARAQVQAQKFGAKLALPMSVEGISCANPRDAERAAERDRPADDTRTGCSPYRLHIKDHPDVTTHTVVIASGASYRTLDLDNFHTFEGAGIYYAATYIEAGLCDDVEVIVVGGGNSAGQAAVFLSGHARHVHMLVRGDSLADSMSDYLVKRIDASDTITLHTQCEIVRLEGDDSLKKVTCRHKDSDEEVVREICHVFLMIGASPNAAWCRESLLTDQNGFLCTGAEVLRHGHWEREDRDPNTFETSWPGVFAVGDVRAGSVKRVASAVGEGSVCVQAIHGVLEEVRPARE